MKQSGQAGTTKDPDVSILMTAYNSEEYLAAAIESILDQECSYNWELIFVDDGSEDTSLAIARDFAGFSNNIKIFHHLGGENRGISASRNLALEHARGKYLAFLDSDDVWLPHHLQTQLCLLHDMPEVAMVYAGAERWTHFDRTFNEEAARKSHWGENFLPPLLPIGQTPGMLPQGELLKWFRQDESLVPCICTVVMRTAVARAVDGFCNEFRGLYDDQAFHAQVILSYAVYANDICTARYRQHSGSCCGQHRQNTSVRNLEQERFHQFLLAYSGDRDLTIVAAES